MHNGEGYLFNGGEGLVQILCLMFGYRKPITGLGIYTIYSTFLV